MKDVWIDFDHSERGRGSLVLYHVGYVHYRSTLARRFCRVKYPLNLFAESHKALRMKGVR